MAKITSGVVACLFWLVNWRPLGMLHWWPCYHVRDVNRQSGYKVSTRAIYTRKYGMFWLKEELSRVHGTLHIFFRNTTVLFVLCSISLIYYFVKPLKILTRSDKHSDDIFLRRIKVDWMSWTFERFHKIINQRFWNFQISILTNKKILFLKKILSAPCTMDSSFFSPLMAPWRPNFPHQRLWFRL